MTGRLGIMTAILFFAGSAFGQDPAKKDSVSTIPAEVMIIIKPSCMPCHSNEGRDKPKAKVNFSVWEQYNPMEKTMLAGSILDEVKKGEHATQRFSEIASRSCTQRNSDRADNSMVRFIKSQTII